MVKVAKEKKKLSKAEFKTQLETLKTSLPSNYGVLLKHFYPEVDVRTVYNVVNYGVHDEKVLQMLTFLVRSKN
jgi:hypothetical protein